MSDYPQEFPFDSSPMDSFPDNNRESDCRDWLDSSCADDSRCTDDSHGHDFRDTDRASDTDTLHQWSVHSSRPRIMDAEQFVIDASDLLPPVRGSLRDEFISEVARIEIRRERLRKVPLAFAFALLMAAFILWPRDGFTRAATNSGSENPLDRLPMTNAGPAPVVSASQQPDSWALVDAYRLVREQRLATIQRSLASDESP